MIDLNTKAALITGGTGFIGSNLIDRLVYEKWEVHAIIRPSSNLTQLDNIKNKITLHIYDGSIESMFKIFELSRPQVVFHLASLFLAEHAPNDITPMIQSNLIFATHLVEAMVKNQVHKLVNTGTSWQHFENKDYSPVCLYAATKQAFEAILQYYLEASPLQAITLKLFDSYGINDPRKKLFSLLDRLLTEQQPLAMSLGRQKINLVYIEDIIDAYLIAAKRLEFGNLNGHHEIYAIGNDTTICLNTIVNIYEQEICKKLPINWGEKPYRIREVMEPWNKGNKLEGWKPKIDIRQGIKQIVDNKRSSH